jgi:hypothetical protein
VNVGFEKRLIMVWLALSAITMSQVGVSWIDGRGGLTRNAIVTSSAIVIALVKVRIIFREFMEVRHAPVALCRLTDGWVVLTGVVLLGAYFVGTALARG